MDFSATIDLIIKDLNEASAIIDDLKRYPGVPVLQVELAKAKCRSAGDVIALLKNLETAFPASKNTIQEEKTSLPEPEIKIPEKTAKSVQQQPDKKKEVIPAPPAPADQTKNEEPSGNTKKVADTTILADKFQAPSELYSEAAAGIKIEKDLSDRLKAKKIKSITDTIGISDKFLFIGSIFEGDKEAYAQVLTRLDNAASLDEAREIIFSYTGEQEESEAVAHLLNLVKLKLESNE